ncbi:MAG: glycosyltransferase family 39 protein [Thermoproteota archaeon]|nr:glycosyltransferase family 39 protein [Thermoproteota archaeon]
MIFIPLLLTAYTHLSNPIGFPPGPLNDENIYIARGMAVLNGLGIGISYFFDHPYFAQVFLAGIFFVIGYPSSLHPVVGDLHSIEVLYLIPRILMGILAVIDSLLIYKIGDRYNNRSVAFTASIIFAVMPITMWQTRWVLLESVQLPFLLASILFTSYLQPLKKNNRYNKNTNTFLALASGILMGLSIFTKIPAFTLIPLIAFLVYRNSNRSLKYLGLWLAPVILIPMIWPAYAMSIGEFNNWLHDVFVQAQRGIKNNSFFTSLNYNFNVDPVFHILSAAGLTYAIAKRDIVILLWIAPFLAFIYLIGFVSVYHFIPIFPAFCIAIARLIVDMSNSIKKKRASRMLHPIVIIGIGVFGLTASTMLIIKYDNLSYFQTTAFLSRFLHDSNEKITVIGNPFYLWIPEFVFHLDRHDYIGFYDNTPSDIKNVVSVADPGLIDKLVHNTGAIQIRKIQQNSNMYHTKHLATFGGDTLDDDVSIYQYIRKPSHLS